MFLQARDAIHYGTVRDGQRHPAWNELGEDGQEHYLADATAVMDAITMLGYRREPR